MAIPVSDVVGIAILPILAIPGCLGGPDRDDGVAIESWVELQIGSRSLEDIAAEHDLAEILTSAEYEGVAFERMLAKIGYGMAVAEFGIDAFETVFVLPHILGKRRDIGRWVGRSPQPDAWDGRSLHQVSVGTRGRTVEACIRLFATENAPTYHVCVGKLAAGSHLIERSSGD